VTAGCRARERRLIGGLLGSTIVQPSIAAAFDGQKTLKEAIGRLRNGANVRLVLGSPTIRAYLGHGDPNKSHRPERAIREAISAAGPAPTSCVALLRRGKRVAGRHSSPACSLHCRHLRSCAQATILDRV
jgi:hypothetical protein